MITLLYPNKDLKQIWKWIENIEKNMYRLTKVHQQAIASLNLQIECLHKVANFELTISQMTFQEQLGLSSVWSKLIQANEGINNSH